MPSSTERPSTRSGAPREHKRDRETSPVLDMPSEERRSRSKRPDDKKSSKSRGPAAYMNVDDIEEDLQPMTAEDAYMSSPERGSSRPKKDKKTSKEIPVPASPSFNLDVEEELEAMDETAAREAEKKKEKEKRRDARSSNRRPKDLSKEDSRAAAMSPERSGQREIVISAFAGGTSTKQQASSLGIGDVSELLKAMKAENDLAKAVHSKQEEGKKKLTEEEKLKIAQMALEGKLVSTGPTLEDRIFQTHAVTTVQSSVVGGSGVKRSGKPLSGGSLGLFVFNSEASHQAQTELKLRTQRERIETLGPKVRPLMQLDPPRMSTTLFEQQPMTEQQKLLNSVGKYSNLRSVGCETAPVMATTGVQVTETRIRQDTTPALDFLETGARDFSCQVPELTISRAPASHVAPSSGSSGAQQLGEGSGDLQAFLSRTTDAVEACLSDASVRSGLRREIARVANASQTDANLLVDFLGDKPIDMRESVVRGALGDLFRGKTSQERPAALSQVLGVPANVRSSVLIGVGRSVHDAGGDDFNKMRVRYRPVSVSIDGDSLSDPHARVTLWYALTTTMVHVPLSGEKNAPKPPRNSELPETMPAPEIEVGLRQAFSGVRSLGVSYPARTFSPLAEERGTGEGAFELLRASAAITSATGGIAGWTGAVVGGTAHGAILVWASPKRLAKQSAQGGSSLSGGVESLGQLIGSLGVLAASELDVQLTDGAQVIVRDPLGSSDESATSLVASSSNSGWSASGTSPHRGAVVDVRPSGAVTGRFVSLDAAGLVCKWKLELGTGGLCVSLLSCCEPSIVSSVLRPAPTAYGSLDALMEASGGLWGGFEGVSNSKDEKKGISSRVSFLGARSLASISHARGGLDLALVASSAGVASVDFHMQTGKSSASFMQSSASPLIMLPNLGDSVLTVAVSPFNPNLVLVACSSGDLYLFDIDSIEPLCCWQKAVWSPVMAASAHAKLAEQKSKEQSQDDERNRRADGGKDKVKRDTSPSTTFSGLPLSPRQLALGQDPLAGLQGTDEAESLFGRNGDVVAWSRTRPCVFFTAGAGPAALAAPSTSLKAPLVNDKVCVWDLSGALSNSVAEAFRGPARILDVPRAVASEDAAVSGLVEGAALWAHPACVRPAAAPLLQIGHQFLLAVTKGCPVALALHPELTTPLLAVPSVMSSLPRAKSKLSAAVNPETGRATVEGAVFETLVLELACQLLPSVVGLPAPSFTPMPAFVSAIEEEAMQAAASAPRPRPEKSEARSTSVGKHSSAVAAESAENDEYRKEKERQRAERRAAKEAAALSRQQQDGGDELEEMSGASQVIN